MVLESTNFLFEKIMQKCLGGIVYDEAASLVPGALFPEDSHRTAGKTQVLVIQGDKGFMDKDSLEASVIGEKYGSWYRERSRYLLTIKEITGRCVTGILWCFCEVRPELRTSILRCFPRWRTRLDRRYSRYHDLQRGFQRNRAPGV